MSKKSKSSGRWLKEHFSDSYVKRAQEEGQRSRAAYKLIEIQQKDHIFKPGMVVVDLGAAPGGWSRVAKQYVGARGRVYAFDRLPMEPLPGVEFIQGDFTAASTFDAICRVLGSKSVDLVISDMAPNISGMKAVDQAKIMGLAELALQFAEQVLKPGGSLLVKIFQGAWFDAYLFDLREKFEIVRVRKPKASRGRSREVYLLAVHFAL